MYVNINLKLLTKLIAHLLVCELRRFQNAQCNDKNLSLCYRDQPINAVYGSNR